MIVTGIFNQNNFFTNELKKYFNWLRFSLLLSQAGLEELSFSKDGTKSRRRMVCFERP